MGNPVHEEDYNGYNIKIYPDTYCDEGPRGWDNLGTMVCWHRRYTLGDKQPKCGSSDWFRELAIEVDPSIEQRIDYWENGNGWAHLNKNCNACKAADAKIANIIAETLEKHTIMLPLYLYDHSGITMRTYPFECRWDSGQVGWIYITKEKICKEFSAKHITKKLRDKIKQYLIGEVEIYDQWLRGDVYGYDIEDLEESCWGFYGLDECIEEAKSIVDWHVKNEKEKAA